MWGHPLNDLPEDFRGLLVATLQSDAGERGSRTQPFKQRRPINELVDPNDAMPAERFEHLSAMPLIPWSLDDLENDGAIARFAEDQMRILSLEGVVRDDTPVPDPLGNSLRQRLNDQ
jgi:hypothetical protein